MGCEKKGKLHNVYTSIPTDPFLVKHTCLQLIHGNSTANKKVGEKCCIPLA